MLSLFSIFYQTSNNFLETPCIKKLITVRQWLPSVEVRVQKGCWLDKKEPLTTEW